MLLYEVWAGSPALGPPRGSVQGVKTIPRPCRGKASLPYSRPRVCLIVTGRDKVGDSFVGIGTTLRKSQIVLCCKRTVSGARVGLPKPGPCVRSAAQSLGAWSLFPRPIPVLPQPYLHHHHTRSPSGQRGGGNPGLRLRRPAFCSGHHVLHYFPSAVPVRCKFSLLPYRISTANILTLFSCFPPQDTVLSPFHQLRPKRCCALFLFPSSRGPCPSPPCPPFLSTGVGYLSFIPHSSEADPEGEYLLPGYWPWVTMPRGRRGPVFRLLLGS